MMESSPLSTSNHEQSDTKPVSPEALFRRLQHMEASCYEMVMSVFKAQGPITWQKHNLLEDLRVLLHIGPQRHRADELRTDMNPLLTKISTQCKQMQLDRSLFDETEVTAEEKASHIGAGLYSHSETESEAEGTYERLRTPAKKSTRRASSGGGTTSTKKRGRKRKDEGATASATSTPRTKKGKVGRPPKEKEDSAITAAMEAILSRTDYREISTLRFEDVEEVAEKEQQQIEELDALLNETVDPTQRQRIMTEVQRKKDKLIQLIQHLEVL